MAKIQEQLKSALNIMNLNDEDFYKYIDGQRIQDKIDAAKETEALDRVIIQGRKDAFKERVSEVRKPIMGIKPREQLDSHRRIEILEAMIRFENEGRCDDIPVDWFDELAALSGYLITFDTRGV